MCLGNPYGKALANESLRSFLGKTKPTLAEGPQSRIVVPVASERLEGGSGVFCNMQAPDIVFSSKAVTNLFFPLGLLT